MSDEINDTAIINRISKVRRNWHENNNNKREGQSMKIGRYYVDYREDCYWVYSKKQLDKKTGKEIPRGTSYFNTLAGALKEVRSLMIGTKIGKDKEDDISEIIAQIATIDAYIVESLEKMPQSTISK